LENAWKIGASILRNSKNEVVKFIQHQKPEVPMNQKFTLILSVSLTAFVLVVGGAMIGQAAQPDTVTLTPDVMEIQNMYAQREAEYQARLEEANAALAEAYAQQTAPIGNSDQPQFEAAAPVPATISPQDALMVAAITAPNARLLRLPELVNYQGVVAYEITLDVGVMYVDANTGTLLYDGTAQPQISVQTRGFHDDDDHEGGEDHDD
jgi:hypothetical protein